MVLEREQAAVDGLDRRVERVALDRYAEFPRDRFERLDYLERDGVVAQARTAL